MPRPNKTRKLWINIRFLGVTSGRKPSRRQVVRTLIAAIQEGTYDYPENWNVEIQWRNKLDAPMRSGEFAAEMQASRASSPGFDMAVTRYLERML